MFARVCSEPPQKDPGPQWPKSDTKSFTVAPRKLHGTFTKQLWPSRPPHSPTLPQDVPAGRSPACPLAHTFRNQLRQLLDNFCDNLLDHTWMLKHFWTISVRRCSTSALSISDARTHTHTGEKPYSKLLSLAWRPLATLNILAGSTKHQQLEPIRRLCRTTTPRTSSSSSHKTGPYPV